MGGLAWAWIGFVLLLGSIARGAEPLKVDVAPVGLDEAGSEALSRLVLDHPLVKRRIENSRYRVVERDFGVLDDAEAKLETTSGEEAPAQPGRFRISIYDYTHDRLLTVSGSMSDRPLEPRIEETTSQPTPSPEEFDEAYAILKADPGFAAAIAAGERTPYEAMPPTVDMSLARSGQGERVLAIGLQPKAGSTHSNEVVGVSLSSRRVFRFPGGAPPTSLALDPACGWSNAGQANTARGVSGSASVTISNSTETLWKFTVIRPSASSGAYGSGPDLKAIHYKGKLMLSRLHVPILNVLYPSGACGPYRDWQYSENPFEAHGADLAPGIRRTTQAPRTIFESGVDRGNFRGVAIHTSGDVILLTIELSAGWYRYMMEYKLHADGTIEPSVKFSAVYNSCVCRTHIHHAYWRMDFDLNGSAGDRIQVSDGDAWRTVTHEAKFHRNARNKLWRVLDVASGAGYEVVPGPHDGTADDYARGDLWALRYRDGQIDDSRVRTSTRAAIDAFNTGEPISSEDVVLWYAGHFRHANDGAETPHVVGPVLRPVTVAP